MGRLLRVALAGLGLALVLAAAGQGFPSDVTVDHQDQAKTFLASACPGGPACIDLDVSSRDFPDPVPAGDEIDYLVTVQNHGPDPSPQTHLTVQLPSGIVPAPGQSAIGPFTANDGTVCPYDVESNTVSCDFGTVENTDLAKPPAVGPRTVTIAFAADPDWVDPTTGQATYPRTISILAAVASEGFSFDRNPDNNTWSIKKPGADASTTVFSPGDLKIVKSHADPMAVSNTQTYDLALTNTAKAATLHPNPPGSGDTYHAFASNPITVTDTLPHGFAFVNSGSEFDDCTATTADLLQSSVVTCHPQVVVPAGGTYHLQLFVRPQATGHFINNANVAKYGGDPSPSDDASSDPTNVGCPPVGASDRTVPALCVTKTDGDSGFPPGASPTDTDAAIFQGKPFNYTIKVTNTHATARGDITDTVTVRDTLPPGMSVSSASVSGGPGSCSTGSGTITCFLVDGLAHGTTRTITLSAIENDTGTFENLVCITEQSCAIELTEVHAAGDLAITKSESATTVNVFGQVTYKLVATNNGPAAMPSPKVTDVLQEGLQVVSVDPAGPTCGVSPGSGGTNVVTCALGTLAKGASTTITIVVSPQHEGVFTNSAKIDPDTTPGAPIDIDPTNNTSATVSFTANAADLAITKTASPTVVGVGQTLTYTLTVTNNGPGDASDVVVKDPLPTALSFATATTTQGSCTGTQSITCNIGAMANDATVTITVRATPTAPGTVTNTASVTASSSDLDDSNNSASVDTRVIAADLAITKVASPSPVSLGITLTYTIKVKNLGPDEATGVSVSDSLPSQVTLPTATPSQGTCFGNPTVTCALGTLAPNTTATVTITVTPIVPDVTITNTAQITSAFDLNSTNNSASVSTAVRQPRLDVTPALGTPGFVPFAIGRNFPPNAPVLLHWSPGLGKKTVVTNAKGSFRAPMLIFPKDLQGPRSLVATAVHPDVPAVAFLDQPADFLVVPATSTPFQTKPKFPVTKLVQRGG